MDQRLLNNILEYYKETIKEDFNIKNDFIATNLFLESLQDEEIENIILEFISNRISQIKE